MKRLGLILKTSKIELRKILLLLVVGLCYSGTVTANNLPPYIYLYSTEGSSSTIVIENGNTVSFEATVGDQDNMGSKSVGIWWRVNSTTKKSDYGRSSYYSHTFVLPAGEYEKEYNVTISVRDNEYTYRSKTIKVIVRDKSRHYYLTDHLGSVRSTVSVFEANSNSSEMGVVSSWDDYYPFGLPMPGRSENSTNADALNKFNGHEMDTQNDINLTYAGARYLDPEIGQWLSVDPLAAKFPEWSPYNYTMGNPMLYIDPDGRDVKKAVAHLFGAVSYVGEMIVGGGLSATGKGAVIGVPLVSHGFIGVGLELNNSINEMAESITGEYHTDPKLLSSGMFEMIAKDKKLSEKEVSTAKSADALLSLSGLLVSGTARMGKASLTSWTEAFGTGLTVGQLIDTIKNYSNGEESKSVEAQDDKENNKKIDKEDN